MRPPAFGVAPRVASWLGNDRRRGCAGPPNIFSSLFSSPGVWIWGRENRIWITQAAAPDPPTPPHIARSFCERSPRSTLHLRSKGEEDWTLEEEEGGRKKKKMMGASLVSTLPSLLPLQAQAASPSPSSSSSAASVGPPARSVSFSPPPPLLAQPAFCFRHLHCELLSRCMD